MMDDILGQDELQAIMEMMQPENVELRQLAVQVTNKVQAMSDTAPHKKLSKLAIGTRIGVLKGVLAVLNEIDQIDRVDEAPEATPVL